MTKLKIYNTTRIIKAIQDNKIKFDILKDLSKQILKVRDEKKIQIGFVKKVYDIVLKNLASSRIKVLGIKNDIYYVNKTGLTKKRDVPYSQNSDNITSSDFFKSLVEVRENLPVFLKVLSPSKRKTFRDFMENAKLLHEDKPITLDMNTHIEWIDTNDNKKFIEKVTVNYSFGNNVNILIGEEDTWRADKINLTNPDFKDYPIIEQLYNQMKLVLEKELKQNKKELENSKKFLADVDTKFCSYIKSVETLNELRKGD